MAKSSKKTPKRRAQRATRRAAGKTAATPRKSAKAATGRRVPSMASPAFVLILDLLRARGGATLAALVEASGTQAHSMRAQLTSIRQAGLKLESSKVEGLDRVYRIK